MEEVWSQPVTMAANGRVTFRLALHPLVAGFNDNK